MDDIDLTTTAMASNGTAVARDGDGMVMFVTGALPGERLTARLTGRHSSYGTAVATQVLEPSPDRIEAPCRHVADGCGGCQWQHVAHRAQITLKESILRDSLVRIGRIADPPLAPTVDLPEWAFRTTLRLAVEDGRAGLRRIRSHELVGVDGCLILHPHLTELITGRRYGSANEVTLRAGVRTGERLAATDPVGVAMDVPPDVRHDHLHEEAAGRRWRVSARSFFQTRPDGVDALARLVLAGVSDLEPSRAVDLYSGVGVFAGVLSDAGWSVTAVESSASACADAVVNLSGTGARSVKADVRRWRPVEADVVVADPSRSGLGPAGVRAVVATGAERVILISCDAASLGRDAGLLRSAGYGVVEVTPVDMFPQSFHVEAVTVFSSAA